MSRLAFARKSRNLFPESVYRKVVDPHAKDTPTSEMGRLDTNREAARSRATQRTALSTPSNTAKLIPTPEAIPSGLSSTRAGPLGAAWQRLTANVQEIV
jgi:hypothetical protein